jgi:Bacterial mobilisation protein (MobC)
MKSLIRKKNGMDEMALKMRTQKGGRPRVPNKRSEALSVMCTLLEKNLIQINARNSGRSVSVFLRDLGIHGRVERNIKVFPKEVLQMIGALNHIGNNINQIAKKRNKGEDLNAMERALLAQEVRGVNTIVKDIKKYLSWSEK